MIACFDMLNDCMFIQLKIKDEMIFTIVFFLSNNNNNNFIDQRLLEKITKYKR